MLCTAAEIQRQSTRNFLVKIIQSFQLINKYKATDSCFSFFFFHFFFSPVGEPLRELWNLLNFFIIYEEENIPQLLLRMHICPTAKNLTHQRTTLHLERVPCTPNNTCPHPSHVVLQQREDIWSKVREALKLCVSVKGKHMEDFLLLPPHGGTNSGGVRNLRIGDVCSQVPSAGATWGRDVLPLLLCLHPAVTCLSLSGAHLPPNIFRFFAFLIMFQFREIYTCTYCT